MSQKKRIILKFNRQPVCETCGKLIYRNERILFLFKKVYHFKCGYNN